MRVKRAMIRRRRKKKIFKLAKGYYGGKSKLFRTAAQAVNRSMVYAYRDRRRKKRDFRKLWIAQINAATRLADIPYNRFMKGMKDLGLLINRKMLAELAISDQKAFNYLVGLVK
jgi:large subunit ribosomal protein L20